MYIDLNPVFLALAALFFALLAFALVRRAGWKGWLVLSALLLVCVATNPDRAAHVEGVRQRAEAVPLRRGSTTSGDGLMAELRSGHFEAMVEYRNLGIASFVVMQGKPVSFGLLGRIWVVNLQRLAHRPRRPVTPG